MCEESFSDRYCGMIRLLFQPPDQAAHELDAVLLRLERSAGPHDLTDRIPSTAERRESEGIV